MQPPINPGSFLRHDTFVIIILTVAALFLRIHYFNNTDIIDPLTADAGQYIVYGHNLADYAVFSQDISATPTPDSFRSPGFPLLLAAALKIGGDTRWYSWAIFFQALLGCLLVPLAYLLTRLFLPRWGVFLVVFMVILSPHLITMTSNLLSETLLAFTILAAITCYAYACKQENLGLFIFAGLLFGASYLTSEVIIFLPPLLALVTYVSLRESAQSANLSRIRRFMVVGTLIFLLFPMGWILRNSFDVPGGSLNGSSRALATLSHGAYPGFIYKDPAYIYQPYREDPEQPKFSSSLKSFGEIFWRRFQERPLRYISWYLLEKPYHLWTWKMTQGTGDLYVYEVRESLFTKSAIANYVQMSMKILHYGWLVLCLLGLGALCKRANRDSRAVPIVLTFSVLIYVTVVYTIFAPWSRYAVPFRPLFYGAGTWALWFFLTYKSIWSRVIASGARQSNPQQST